MGLRPTKTNEGASDRCRGINNLDRVFNRAVTAREESTVYKMVSEEVAFVKNRPLPKSFKHPAPPLLPLRKCGVFHPLVQLHGRLRTDSVIDSGFFQQGRLPIGRAVESAITANLAIGRPLGCPVHPLQAPAQHLRIRLFCIRSSMAVHQFPIHNHAARRFPQRQLTAKLRPRPRLALLRLGGGWGEAGAGRFLGA